MLPNQITSKEDQTSRGRSSNEGTRPVRSRMRPTSERDFELRSVALKRLVEVTWHAHCKQTASLPVSFSLPIVTFSASVTYVYVVTKEY
jgi:hypothetical protein